MALRGTLTHWKTQILAEQLGVDLCFALGILEALWHTTATSTPCGDIGKLPNHAIARAIFYTGDADKLVAALIASGHIDAHPEYRLVIHDWAEHSDFNTRRKVARHGKQMVVRCESEQVVTHDDALRRVIARPPESEP